MSNLILTAPLAGWAASLDEVPDPVFAQRMLGDGIAIDPTEDLLRAPCAGEILTLHAAGHAVSLRAAGGAEIMMHIGLETVALAGEGFRAHVAVGDVVAAGAPLIGFDMDLVARRAASLITPILITNGEAFAIVRRSQDQRIEAGAFLLELEPRAQAAAGADRAQGEVSRQAILDLVHGLHARPAARIAAEAKRFAAEVEIALDGRSASARSPVAIMALGAGAGAALTVSAAGADAPAAVAAVCALIEHCLAAYEAPAAATPPPLPAASDTPGHIAGLRGAPGLAIGAAVRLHPPEIAVAQTAGGAGEESAALAAALADVRARLEALSRQGPAPQREIIGAHLAILDDHELAAASARAIAGGSSAGAAWRAAIRAQAERLRALADPRLAERADDLLDLEHQVLVELSGEAAPVQTLPAGSIVLAHDLAPSQVVALPDGVAGLLTAAGGPTSHVAILAAARDIPAVVAAGPGVMAIADGTTLILDGDAGIVAIAPGAEAIGAAQSRLAERHERRRAAIVSAALECRMADGTRIEVFANLGAEADAVAAVENGAEGCGLLRTEFLFLGRRTTPGEDEQAAIYQAIAATLAPRPLIIRTLDIGGDKPVPYLAMPAEENPALGVRGVRVGLRNRDLLATQLAAILRVRPAPRIMVPMVASLAEFLAVKAMVEAIRADFTASEPAVLGVMIETPAAAVTADLLARHADFLSVGTNDLSQYVLAMDRGNPALAAEIDALHPAVLRLIGQAVAGGGARARPVGVCGGLAADPAAVPILIGLGASSLSAPPAAVPGVKALVRTLTLARCQAVAERAVALASAAEVRALVAEGNPPMTLFGARFSFAGLQPLGRALMLPIAVLPVAGLLLRLGQPDLLNIGFVAAAGEAIFHNLGLLFAIGVAVGFARDGNGAAGLAGVVCFLVATNGAQALITAPADAVAGMTGKARDLAVAAFRAGALFKLSVPLGIASGVIAGAFYNRFGTIKLPPYLAFFGGRRFVPIVSGVAGLALAIIAGFGWTFLDRGIDALSHAIVRAGPVGLFVYGVLNRLLIVTGLHHIVNNVVWFIIGDYHGATGDLNRFFAGDPTAGSFMAGFFPVMMFGLPAACLAMFHAARPERRAEVGGLLLSLALTALLTGVTEPIEFSFMFLAPVLFVIHALLTGAAMVTMDVLHVKLGFGFSAGLFDYLLNFGKATRPLLLIPVGLVYFGLYYGLFRFFIARFDLKTPGREDAPAAAATPAIGVPLSRPRGFIEALGGAANLVSVDACTTRLRLVVADQGAVDEPALKALGALGFVRPSARDLQVVVGPVADEIAREMREALQDSPRRPDPTRPASPSTLPMEGREGIAAFPIEGREEIAEAMVAALGGPRNVTGLETHASRLRIAVARDSLVDEGKLHALGVRGVARPAAGIIHFILGQEAEATRHALALVLAGAHG